MNYYIDLFVLNKKTNCNECLRFCVDYCVANYKSSAKWFIIDFENENMQYDTYFYKTYDDSLKVIIESDIIHCI